MKIRTIGILPLFGVALSITPAWAGPVGVQRSSSAERQSALVAQLEARQEQDWREAQRSHARGPLLVRYMDRSARLQDLMNRIQAGEQVSPDEIDQALQPGSP
jgi:hypothetical protein